MSTNLEPLRLVDFVDDARFWSVLDMLKDAVKNLEECPEENKPNKAIVIFLDDHGTKYNTSFAIAGMLRHEILGLLEVMKLIILRRLIGDDRVRP